MNRRSTVGVWRSLSELQEIVQSGDQSVAEETRKDKEKLDAIRETITVEMKQNTILHHELKELDASIKLHVRQNMSVRDIIAKSQHLKSLDRKGKDGSISLGKTKRIYEEMFDILQLEPKYCAQIAQFAETAEMHTFAQIVTLTLYGDQYEARLERQLLLMFDHMLESEFANCDDLGTFMRANTGLTHMLSSYCKRGQGKGLLKDVLGQQLTELATSTTTDFEINPVKVYQGLIKKQEMETGQASTLNLRPSAEEAASNPEVRKIVAERTMQLQAEMDRLFDNIVQNVHNIPFGVRWISKRLRELAFSKWPRATVDQVNSIVGGVVFLRYMTPAITTPDALHIIDKPVSYRRNNILLAKVLQNLSNGLLFGSKEQFMLPMNTFLESSKEKLAYFFDELCNVESLDDHMRMEIVYSLDSKQQYITLAVNDIYFVHGLLEKYRGKVLSSGGDVLLAIVERLGGAPQKVKREEDYPVNLTMGQSGHESSVALQMSQEEEDEKEYPLLREKMIEFLSRSPQIGEDVGQQGFVPALAHLKSEATARSDFELASLLTDINSSIAILVAGPKYETSQEVYHQLARDISKNVDLRQKIRFNLSSAIKVLSDIRAQRKDMEETSQIHLDYLKNIEMRRSSENGPTIVIPPKEYSHRELEEKRVITESRLPLDVRKRVRFIISTDDCQVFTVSAKYKFIAAFSVQLRLSDLLAKQENNEHDLNIEGEVTLNVNLLMHLLNKHFIAVKEQRMMQGKGKKKK